MSRHSSIRVLAISAVAILGLSSCARWFRSPPPGLTDANIAAILLAANNTDISYGQLAPTRARNQAILDFASRMVTDHTGVNDLAAGLFTKLDLTPVENVTSLDFRDESAAKRDTLRELSGRPFDSTYIMNELSYHTRLLVALDSVLIPKSKAPELRQLLTNIRPAVAAHLEHAQRVRVTVLGR